MKDKLRAGQNVILTKEHNGVQFERKIKRVGRSYFYVDNPEHPNKCEIQVRIKDLSCCNIQFWEKYKVSVIE